MNRILATLFVLGVSLQAGCRFGEAATEATGHDGPTVESTVTTEPTTGRLRVDAWITSMCRLYTEPACVRDQAESCSAHLAFADEARCRRFFEDTAASCDGLPARLQTNVELLDACKSEMDAYTCGGKADFCDASGARVGTRGACARVAELIDGCGAADTGM